MAFYTTSIFNITPLNIDMQDYVTILDEAVARGIVSADRSVEPKEDGKFYISRQNPDAESAAEWQAIASSYFTNITGWEETIIEERDA